jgi:hypothetical protein
VENREPLCYLKDIHSTPRPRDVGALIPVRWQLFTNEKEEVAPPVQVLIPNEITLSQLVAYAIVPEYRGRFDINTCFKWCLEEIQVQQKKGEKIDKTKREMVPIPMQFPEGFVLRVSASSIHKDDRGRRLVEVRYQGAHLYLTIRTDATIETLKTAIVNLMRERGLGDQWMTEREPHEAIDFDYC